MSLAARMAALGRRLPCPDAAHAPPVEVIDLRDGGEEPPASPRPAVCPTCGRALPPIYRMLLTNRPEARPDDADR